MIDTDSLFSRLPFHTVRIEATLTNGKSSTGTGFFMDYGAGPDNDMATLITNKHVIENATSITFFVHQADASGNPVLGKSFPVTLDDDTNHWVHHPNPDIDLCALLCKPLIRKIKSTGRQMYYKGFGDKLLPTQQTLEKLLPMEDVIMIGAPIGLWDNFNNFPLFRRGITASHPALDFQGKPIGVVDIAAFPGSSGSPILVANTEATLSGVDTGVGVRPLLLGILFAGPQFKANGEITIVDIPTTLAPRVTSEIPAHLGIYIKSRELANMKRLLIDYSQDNGLFLQDHG